MIGRKISHYNVTEKLGAGGMGEVYRATDTKLNRDVALKVLPEEFARDADRMARFKREAQVLASLNHPNIAAIYGLEEADGIHCLVLELVEGPTLAERIAAGPLPLKEALEIARQIADALEAAHEKGIIHRDLKPANVKVTHEGTVKVLDFGLAKALEGESAEQDVANSPTLSMAATQAGVILGTAAYMSPEQARGQRADRRADVWSFGVVLFEMLTGQRAFTGETVSDVLAAVLRAELDWDSLPPQTPPAIRRLLQRCLTKDKRRRLGAISEATFTLDEYLADPSASSTESAPAAVVLLPAWQRTLPWAVAGALGVVATVALWGWLSPPPAEPPVVTRFPLDFPMVESFGGGCCGRMLALSPSGDRFAFGAQADGVTLLYVRAMDQLDPVALAGTENATTPFFSPDGRWIAFFADGKLKKISLDGGAPLTLCDVGTDPRGGAWGPDDTIVFASAGNSALFRVSAGGGTPKPVTEIDYTSGETAHRWPEFLPSGKAVLFTAFRGTVISIEVLWLESGQRHLLLENASQPAYASSGHLVYAQMPSQGSGGRLGNVLAVSFDAERAEVTGSPVPILENVIAWSGGGTNFVLSRNGTLAFLEGVGGFGQPNRLVWVDREGKEEFLVGTAALYSVPRISPDGGRIALTITENFNPDVWVHDLRRGTLARLTFELLSEITPVWSPDGSKLAFSVGDLSRINLTEIKLISADGSSPAETISSSELYTRISSWSPDGNTLVLTETNPTGDDIKTLALEGDGNLSEFLATDQQERDAVFSFDGRWVAYVSSETGNNEIYVRPFIGPGGKWQISSGGGTSPVWSRDGRELFYRNGNRMMIARIEPGETFRASRPEVLFEGSYEYSEWGRNYDVSPDGKRFLMTKFMTEQQTAAPTINLVISWLEELRRRVPTGKN